MQIAAFSFDLMDIQGVSISSESNWILDGTIAPFQIQWNDVVERQIWKSFKLPIN